jgi:hypothetical protein
LASADIRGLGVTTGDWNMAHEQTSWACSGCAYDPDSALPQVNGHAGSDYFAVLHSDGRVLQYVMAFAPGTPKTEAINAVIVEFPSDVRRLWTARKDTCLQLEVASAHLGKVLSQDPRIGDPRGRAFVELTSDEDTQGNASYLPSLNYS